MLANCGDSRTSLAYKTDTGIHAINLTIDHKPDLPLEKVFIHKYINRAFIFVL